MEKIIENVPVGLVWLRRDLRLTDHAALYHALKHCRQVFVLFVFDREILDGLPPQDRRVAFIYHSLKELAQILSRQGSALIVRYGWPREVLPQLVNALGAHAVFANHDYEPAAQQRDQAMSRSLQKIGCAFYTFKDQVVFEGDEILNQQGRFYSVFTPYKNAWLSRVNDFDLKRYCCELYYKALAPVPHAIDTHFPALSVLGFDAMALSPTVCGASVAERWFAEFVMRIGDYQKQRDFPALEATSTLSVHLRFGTLSIRTAARTAYTLVQTRPELAQGAQAWLNELIWRDFYSMILQHAPRVVTHAFKPEYDALIWEDAPADFAAWCRGETGYPLVDAAMRQLNQTGFMHNRLRMVTACFLVKDLGMDWRQGERYFATHLNDYDMASNNGGWQWCASTGCDAQPYFRIFNPVTQSEKFDPQGAFIKRYLPQLSGLPLRAIHAPWQLTPEQQADYGVVIGRDYPAPIVNHAVARQRTLARYARVRRV